LVVDSRRLNSRHR
jgi:hypothetical protein